VEEDEREERGTTLGERKKKRWRKDERDETRREKEILDFASRQ